jgi:RNA polymerase-binding transcription factor DksA
MSTTKDDDDKLFEPVHDNHLGDDTDQATFLEEAHRRLRLASVRSQCIPHRQPLPDGTYEDTECEDCGAEIGIERQRVAINNHLCIHCATFRERKST